MKSTDIEILNIMLSKNVEKTENNYQAVESSTVC